MATTTAETKPGILPAFVLIALVMFGLGVVVGLLLPHIF
jgi:hypothetical protein